jgi:hypothetical protein
MCTWINLAVQNEPESPFGTHRRECPNATYKLFMNFSKNCKASGTSAVIVICVTASVGGHNVPVVYVANVLYAVAFLRSVDVYVYVVAGILPLLPSMSLRLLKSQIK